MRMTRQRQVILEELGRVKTHPTAEEVYEMVRVRLPRISLGTVYRNLELLAAAGRILKIGTAGTRKRFDAVATPHYHLRCLGCGKVSDVPIPVDTGLNLQAEQMTGYRISCHHLEFHGYCPECRLAARLEPEGMVDELAPSETNN